MIKIHNYFYDDDVVDSVVPKKIRQGETIRSLNNRAHTTIIGKNNAYWRFTIELEGVTTEGLYNLFDVEDYLYEEDNDFIEFMDEQGEEYELILPMPTEDNFTVSGEKDNFSVTLVLEEGGSNLYGESI